MTKLPYMTGLGVYVAKVQNSWAFTHNRIDPLAIASNNLYLIGFRFLLLNHLCNKTYHHHSLLFPPLSVLVFSVHFLWWLLSVLLKLH